MIIWSGYGFLVAVFVFVSVLATNQITNALSGSEEYWDTRKWPAAVAMLVAAAACYLVGNWLRNSGTRTYIDEETGQRVRLGRSDTLFFIPMIYWGLILAFLGVAFLGLEFAQ